MAVPKIEGDQLGERPSNSGKLGCKARDIASGPIQTPALARSVHLTFCACDNCLFGDDHRLSSLYDFFRFVGQLIVGINPTRAADWHDHRTA
jgi:hypothetical protein